MNRRDALKVGVTVAAAPALAQTKPEPKSAWKPSVLTEHQNATVVVLTDLIIPATDTPGAKDAQVNRYIDLFLKDGRVPERDRFLQGLAWLDDYSKTQHKDVFVKLSQAAQVGILKKMDAGGEPSMEEGHRFFRMLKGMTSRFYYNTEAGFREMNKGGRVPSGVGCGHTGKHA